MVQTKKSLLIALCLLLVVFKAMAGNVFIQSAIERAHLQISTCPSIEAQQQLNVHDSGDDREPVHNMYLMYHVTANINEVAISIPLPSESITFFAVENERIHLSNIPDSLYKPPRKVT